MSIVGIVKAVKTAKKVVEVVGDAAAVYSAVEMIVGHEGVKKIAYRVTKSASKMLDPAIAADPTNPYEIVIADLKNILEHPPLADLAGAAKQPTDAKVLSALLEGEDAVRKLVVEWRAMNGSDKHEIEFNPTPADKTITSSTAPTDPGKAATNNVLNMARDYLYHKRKSAEIQGLSEQINKREAEFIKTVAADPLTGAMLLDHMKVFTLLLETAVKGYYYGKRDIDKNDRYAIINDTETGKPHRIYGYTSFAPDRTGTNLFHKAAAVDNDFYMEKLMGKDIVSTNKKPPVPHSNPRDADGMTLLMRSAKELKYERVKLVLNHPDVHANLTDLVKHEGSKDDGSSIFDLVLDAGDKKDAATRVQGLLAVLTPEQKKTLLNLQNGKGHYPLSRVLSTDHFSPTLARTLVQEGASQPANAVTTILKGVTPDGIKDAVTSVTDKLNVEDLQKVGGNIAKSVGDKARRLRDFLNRNSGPK